MCQHGRFIVNKYDGREYFVNCGHCPACLQEKANQRVERIRRESNLPNLVSYIVTLDYTNDFVPYVKYDEYKRFLSNPFHGSLNVYRGNGVERLLDYDDFCSGDSFSVKDFYKHSIKDLKYLRRNVHNGYYDYFSGRVGILYLRDIQLFVKRFRINLDRSGYKGYFSYFYTGEYGTKTFRPHCHFLFFVESGIKQDVRLLLNKSWPYADLLKPRKTPVGYRCCVELAKNPAAYLASYINLRSVIPPLLSSVRPFKIFYHFSNGFGFASKEFSLPSILYDVERGCLSFTETRVVEGCPTFSETRIPKLVLLRYFPKFKGYNLLSSDEIVELARCPQRIFFLFKSNPYCLTYDDRFSIFQRLSNLRSRIPLELVERWCLVYPRVWSLYASDSIKHSYDDCILPEDMFYHFYNISDWYSARYSNGVLDGLLEVLSIFPHITDPNNFPSNVAHHQYLSKEFNEFFKHHEIKQFVYEI